MLKTGLLSLMIIGLFSACTPTVYVAADKPIEINLNIKIEHEIRIRVDRDLDSLFDKDSDLF